MTRKYPKLGRIGGMCGRQTKEYKNGSKMLCAGHFVSGHSAVNSSWKIEKKESSLPLSETDKKSSRKGERQE